MGKLTIVEAKGALREFILTEKIEENHVVEVLNLIQEGVDASKKS
jgi:hypothetical protein